MATLVGKVGMVMKGDWSSSATYEALDAVSYNNGMYIAKQDVPANTAPTNTTYWQSAIDTSRFVNIAEKNVANADYIEFTSKVGTLIIFSRSAMSTYGIYYLDAVNEPVALIPGSGNVTVTKVDTKTKITNNCGAVIAVTIIYPFSDILP